MEPAIGVGFGAFIPGGRNAEKKHGCPDKNLWTPQPAGRRILMVEKHPPGFLLGEIPENL